MSMLILGMIMGLFKNIFSPKLRFFGHFLWDIRCQWVILTPGVAEKSSIEMEMKERCWCEQCFICIGDV